MEYVHNYAARYLLSDRREANETYTYGSWLARGVDRVRDQLRRGRGTNQAAIAIGGWLPLTGADGRETWVDTDDFIDPATGERDPACLRLVDFRLDSENRLHMIVYFRSWDLWGGLPANLAGLQLVKAVLAAEVGAEDGTIVASSKGLHLYDHAYEVAARRVGMSPTVDLAGFVRFVEERR
jgi:thymidylate synthase